MTLTNQQWLLAARPQGPITPDIFQWREAPVPAVDDGQVRVRNVYLSLDPAMRGWMNAGGSYMPAVEIGAVMRGGTVGIVEESRAAGFAPGDIVQGTLGWQTYAVVPGRALLKLPLPADLPLEAQVGLFNHIGLTAWFGLFDVGQPQDGETLVVSGAAGAVGSLVVQMGRIRGLRVVGIAGSDDKCRRLVEELGADAAVNYKTENVRQALRSHCPDGIDIVFENVGGEILDASLAQINLGARVALCGLISQYNATAPVPGPYYFGNLIVKRARIQGFLVSDYYPRVAEALPQMVQWYRDGRLRYELDVVEGLEQAPTAINRLFSGEKRGKLAVRVSAEP